MKNKLTKSDLLGELAKWEPFGELNRELSDFRSRMMQLLGRGNGEERALLGESDAFADWMPAVDVSEDDNEYLIKDGVLTVHLPKSEARKHQEKEIAVH